MAAMEWSEELSVGIPSIDKQHKFLISLLNDLTKAILDKKADAKLEDIFDKIIKYTIFHFDYEEKMFLGQKYADAPAHLEEHKILISQVLELQEKFKLGKVSVSAATHKFLVTWIKHHIIGTDKKYSKFLIRRGVV